LNKNVFLNETKEISVPSLKTQKIVKIFYCINIEQFNPRLLKKRHDHLTNIEQRNQMKKVLMRVNTFLFFG